MKTSQITSWFNNPEKWKLQYNTDERKQIEQKIMTTMCYVETKNKIFNCYQHQQLKKKLAIQPNIFLEMEIVVKIAFELKLTFKTEIPYTVLEFLKNENLQNFKIRNIFANNKFALLQGGAPKSDDCLILNLENFEYCVFEFKGKHSKLIEFDLPLPEDNGFIQFDDMNTLKNKNLNKIIPIWNDISKINIFENIGTNNHNFDVNKLKMILKDVLECKRDFIFIIEEEDSCLKIIDVNELLESVDIIPELRTCGKNSFALKNKIECLETLQNNPNFKLMEEGQWKVEKEKVFEMSCKGRKTNKISRLKINNIFYISLKHWDQNSDVIFCLDNVKQIKPTFSIIMKLKGNKIISYKH